MTRDSKGNLYGVTNSCGAEGYYGALYELSASSTYTLLHSFDYTDGLAPIGEVLQAQDGALYGTTLYGGANDWGTVWEYMPRATGVR